MFHRKNSKAKWTVMERSCLLKEQPWLEIYSERVKLPGGEIVPKYLSVEMPQCVSIFSITTSGKVLLLEGYRHAVGDITLGMPGGMVELGETTLEAARRELLEETGYISDDWISLGNYFGNAARGCGRYEVFVAIDSKEVQKPESGDLENVDLIRLSTEEVAASLAKEKFQGLGGLCTVLLGMQYLRIRGLLF